jgi:mono/diheme cytochrome c family protein
MRLKSFSHQERFPAAGCWPVASLILILTPGLGFSQAPQLPPGDGRDLVATACTQCHALRPIVMKRDGVGGWRATVEEMVIRGAQLLPEEAESVVRYLAANFGPGPNPMPTGTLPPGTAASSPGAPASSVSLPAGPGKEAVETRCSICHDLGRVVGSRRTREEWERITRNMIERGPQAPPDQVQAIISYLSTQFGRESQ